MAEWISWRTPILANTGHLYGMQPHYGVRTNRYKLIYFNKLDQWELLDLAKDPHEMKNLYGDPAYAKTVKKLKAELYRLKKELDDTNQFEDATPKDDV